VEKQKFLADLFIRVPIWAKTIGYPPWKGIITLLIHVFSIKIFIN
jgi:hypothetical protein